MKKLSFAVALVASSFAFADVVVPDVLSPPPATVLGTILIAGLGLLLSVGAWAMKKLGDWIAARTAGVQAGTAQGIAVGLVNKIWMKAQVIGAKAVAKEKPLMEKILADGQVTHEEVVQLQQAILADLPEILKEEIPLFGTVLGMSTNGSVQSFLAGLAAKIATNILNPSTGTAAAALSASPVKSPP